MPEGSSSMDQSRSPRRSGCACGHGEDTGIGLDDQQSRFVDVLDELSSQDKQMLQTVDLKANASPIIPELLNANSVDINQTADMPDELSSQDIPHQDCENINDLHDGQVDNDQHAEVSESGPTHVLQNEKSSTTSDLSPVQPEFSSIDLLHNDVLDVPQDAKLADAGPNEELHFSLPGKELVVNLSAQASPLLSPNIASDILEGVSEIIPTKMEANINIFGTAVAVNGPRLLSELPHVLRMLFSKIDCSCTLASMGILCTSFQTVWRSYPRVVIHMGRRPSANVITALSHTLMRREDSSLNVLCLSGAEDPFHDEVIRYWFASLLSKHSNDFTLAMQFNHSWRLPHDLFFLHLKSLSLENSVISVPDGFTFPALKELTLISCQFLDLLKNSVQQLIAMCPVIEFICITDPALPPTQPYEITVIEALYLQTLELDMRYNLVDWFVEAPSLSYLKDPLSFTFPNLRRLCMENYSEDDLGFLCNFLQQCPELEYLEYKSTDAGNTTEGVAFWMEVEHLILSSRLRNLRHVHIKEFRGTLREFRLLECFLRCLVLDEVSVTVHKAHVNILEHTRPQVFLDADPLARLKRLDFEYPEIDFNVYW